MTTPLDAATQVLENYEGPSHANGHIAAEIIDAWLRATVAHQPCRGTGRLDHAEPTWGIPDVCLGPHTPIKVGVSLEDAPLFGIEGKAWMDIILFADPERVRTVINVQQGVRTSRWAVWLPLPEGWVPHD